MVIVFGRELWSFLPVRGSDPFITEIKHISSVSTGCLSAELGSKLREAYLWGGGGAGEGSRHRRVTLHKEHDTFCFVHRPEDLVKSKSHIPEIHSASDRQYNRFD